MRLRPLLCLALWALAAAAGAQPPDRARLQQVVLSNGLRVAGYRDESTTLVGVFLVVKVGAAAEGEELRGARSLLQEVFRTRLEQELRSRPEYFDLTGALLVSGGLDLNTEWEYVSLAAQCPRAELAALLRVIGQVLFVEPLAPAAFQTARDRLQGQWEAGQADPAQGTYSLLRRAMLGPDAAAEPVFADPQRAASLDLAAVSRLRADYYVTANSLLLLVGPGSPEELIGLAVDPLVVCPRGVPARAWRTSYPLLPTNVQVGQNPSLHSQGLDVASLMIGFRFPRQDSADFPAGLVVQEMLSGREGLLPTSEKLLRALASLPLGQVPTGGFPLRVLSVTASGAPHLVVSLQTPPDALEDVRQAVLETVNQIEVRARDPQTLERAKRRALNTLALAGLDQQGRARRLAEWLLYARSYPLLQRLPAQIEAVDAAAVARVARQAFARQYVALQLP